MTSDIEISSDHGRIDVALVHAFLSTSYWAKGRPIDVVDKAIRNSLCFGAYSGGKQVAFARLVTDRAVFAYLADVFVIPEFRGRGIAKRMLEQILKHEDIQGLKLIRLSTRDTHEFYEQFGFKRMTDPDKAMELFADAGDS